VAYTALVDWPTTILLATVLFLLGLVALRGERRLRRWIILLLPIPSVYLILRWAAYRQAWDEAGVAALLALTALGIWWRLRGRHLPPPASSIRVWSKDDPF